MADPLRTPFTASDLAELPRVVARLWIDAAQEHGVDPMRVTAECSAHGVLWCSGGELAATEAPGSRRRALTTLALMLRDAPYYYAVEEGGSWRVVGFASVIDRGPRGFEGAPAPVPLRDLYAHDATDPRVEAYNRALVADRQARHAGSAPDAKIEGARVRHEAAYGRRT